ncbi:hypothetical protein GQ44DRAFT_442526 [Phaeosphaeriaceae sp. PMI808]|nr:hypothetical protein GQ44DRAFT_442526 [Phaeosphaeriaceae sp. PMI808]
MPTQAHTPHISVVADDARIIDQGRAVSVSGDVYVQEQNETRRSPKTHQESMKLSSFSPHTGVIEEETVNYDDTNLNSPSQDIDLDDVLQAYQAPPRDVAHRLILHFKNTVHKWIPIISTLFLEKEVHIYYEQENPLVKNIWLVRLNLVLAISARHLFLANGSPDVNHGSEREDTTYLNKAILLFGLHDSMLTPSKPNIMLVQCHGLLSLYYLTVHQVEQAWLSIGVAVRYGVALNLHLKCDDNIQWASESETFSQTWWSLQILDSLLSACTGRPTAFSPDACNAPLPSGPLNTSHQDRLLIAKQQVYIKIATIIQEALSSLYTGIAATSPWDDTQDQVIKLKLDLNALLPQIQEHQSPILQFSWFDAMVIITRPCLIVQEHRTTLSTTALQISQDMAWHCIQSAQIITQLLPDEPDESIYHTGPWWYLAQYIMRAIFVFKLAATCHVFSTVKSDVALSVDKLTRWQHWMQRRDSMAAEDLAAIFNIRTPAMSQAELSGALEQEGLDFDRLFSENMGNVTSVEHIQDLGGLSWTE